jgi:hypothetical protein
MGDAKKPGTTGPGRRFARLVGVIAAVAIGLGVLGLAVVVYVLPKMDSMAAINNHRLGDPPRPIDRSPITAEDARAALVRMTEQSDDQWMKGHAPWIADAQAHDYGRGDVWFGPWQCNLASKAFAANFELEMSALLYNGVFAKDASGVWQATITNTLNPLLTEKDLSRKMNRMRDR